MATTYEIEQLLVREAGRIGPEIYRRTVDTSIWNKVASQSTETFPEEMGDTVSVLTFERSLPHAVNSSGEAQPFGWSDTLRSNPTNGRVALTDEQFSPQQYVDPTEAASPNAANVVYDQSSFGVATTQDGASRNNVNPPLIGNIRFGQTLRKYSLAHAAIESPDIGLNDLMFPVRRREQLSNMMSVLSEATNYIWQERYRDEYIRLSGNKFIAKAVKPTAGSTTTSLVATGSGAIKAENLAINGAGPGTILAGTVAPTAGGGVGTTRINAVMGTTSGGTGVTTAGTIADGVYKSAVVSSADVSIGNLEYTSLKKLYLSMIRDGASTNAMGRENGAPLFLLVTSAETSENLIWQYTRNGEKLSTDLRYAKPNELLAPLGIERSYFGFFHAIDMHLPRFKLDADAGFVRIYPYIRSTSATKGYRWDVNPAYEAAPYEASILYHKDVCSYLVPKAPSVTPAGADFDAPSYRGDFKWVNIKDRTTNPDGLVGYYRAVFGTGTKPVQPYFGYVIIHKRADVL
jgi:hypothetical protein